MFNEALLGLHRCQGCLSTNRHGPPWGTALATCSLPAKDADRLPRASSPSMPTLLHTPWSGLACLPTAPPSFLLSWGPRGFHFFKFQLAWALVSSRLTSTRIGFLMGRTNSPTELRVKTKGFCCCCYCCFSKTELHPPGGPFQRIASTFS